MHELTEQAVEELRLIEPDTAALVNAEHAACLEDCAASREKAESAKDRALRIGEALAKIKEAIPGKFGAWIQVNCTFDRRTASKYMAFAESVGNHGSQVTPDMTLRQAYVALDIIPHRPREGGGTFRGGGIPSVYDPLNALNRLLGAVDKSGAAQAWEEDEEERRAVQAQYKPKLEDFILRLFGVKVDLPAAIL